MFTVAAGEQWRLADAGPNRKTLVIGNEDWPFPVPLVKAASGWRFDTAAGKEEVLARRIGRNELAAIETARAYVTAQRRYAQQGHDGKPAGVYATTFRSDPGKENGLYWPVDQGSEAESAWGAGGAGSRGQDARCGGDPRNASPFHGYYFKILTAQGAAAPGGAKSYVVKGDMSGGFALIAWPAQYDATGVMTFLVNQDGIVLEKDLGTRTDAAAREITSYNPDAIPGVRSDEPAAQRNPSQPAALVAGLCARVVRRRTRSGPRRTRCCSCSRCSPSCRWRRC